ncbi:MAG: DASS family sodium-coupled anion symporter [Bacteroidota bacterium]
MLAIKRRLPGAKQTGLILGPALFFLIMALPLPEGMGLSARAILASTVWIGTWWVTEAIPIPVTALMPIIIFPLSGGLELKATTGAFGNPLIFLFVGGFIIAAAIRKWNLHQRIATNIIYWLGSKANRVVLGFMVATAFLSMWISNTATAVMMVPIGVAIAGQMGGDLRDNKFGKALMLGVAYAASIGGIATLIGTPTNVIFTGVVSEMYGINDITFAKWMLFGLPISLVLLYICWQYLTRIAFPMKNVVLNGGREEIERQLKDLGPITKEEKLVLYIFGGTALAWMTRSFLLEPILPGINDTIIAIAGAAALFFIPAPSNKEMRLLDWETATNIPWGVILLFGGGLAIANGFKTSGLAEYIGELLMALNGSPLLVLILLLIASVNFLTEITSNVATASMILPILGSMAIAMAVHPYAFMVAVTLATSCAFMLPVATPPNAIVFGSNMLKIKDMVQAGVWMNVISILIMTAYVYFCLPVIWGIELFEFPEAFREIVTQVGL